jgi:hypothetical protein
MTNIYPQPAYEIYLDTPTGLRLALVESFTRLSTVRRRNAVGRFALVLPTGTLDDTFIRPDALLEIWRAPHGAPARLWMAGLVRQPELVEVNGADQLVLSGHDGNGLLDSRIVAYYADTAQAAKTDQADDMMKAIVRENLGSSAVAARDLTAYGLTVAADVGLGPSITKKMAWKTVLDALKAIADTAVTAGTPVYFDLVPQLLSATQIGWLFQTFVNRRGVDRTYTVGVPTVFGREWGNLENPRLVYDYSDEVTYAYVGGQGEGSDREVVELGDTARIGQSPWNRREKFIQGSNETSTAALTARAQQALEEGRPRVRFSGSLKDTPQTRFGIDWDFGDTVPVTAFGRQFDADVDAVTITVDENGLEDIDARIEVVT